jgi:MYXO-CTERM domain-containing protein
MRFRPALIGLTLVLALAPPGTARSDVYVGQLVPPAVLVFATDALGDSPPIRVIAGPHTGLNNIDGITVDDEHQELYVSNFMPAGAVLVFALGANGDVAPLRTLIDGPSSQLGFPRRVAIDLVHDELVIPRVEPPSSKQVSTGDGVKIYPRTASGDVAPLRSITTSDIVLFNPTDIVLRPASDEIITNSSFAGGVLVAGLLGFPRTASGVLTPSRILTGSATHFDGFTNWLAYDPATDEIYADTGGTDGVAVFPGAADGNVAPLRIVSGPDTALHNIRGIAFDAAQQRVIVIDSDNNFRAPIDSANLRVFQRTDDGDVPAIMTVGGPSTMMLTPVAIALDRAGGFTGAGPRVLATRPGFAALVADPSALRTESFDGGPGSPGVTFCDATLDAGSNNHCFAPGQLLGGFTVSSRSGTGVAVFGDTVLGNPSAAVGASTSGDATALAFAAPVSAVSMDVYYEQPTQKNGGVVISVYGADNRLLSVSSVYAAAPGQGVFVGVVSPIPIARVEAAPGGTTGLVAIDNLQTTGLAPVQIGDDAGADAGGGMNDAGTSGVDAGTSGVDAGTSGVDAGTSGVDAVPAPAPGGGCGCRVGSDGSGVAPLLLAVAAVCAVRRRRYGRSTTR